MRGLYPIVDLDSLSKAGVAPRAFAERVLAARPALIQVRAKLTPARVALEALEQLLPLARAGGALLFANDRPDLALLSGADGVHIGQDDLPLPLVRRLGPGLRVGVSTHDLDQLTRALDLAPDYVAFGPVFTTSTKQNPDPVVGLERLALAGERARERGIPLVAIGGIDLTRAPSVARCGAAGAVIGALLDTSLDGIQSRALDLHRALGGV